MLRLLLVAAALGLLAALHPARAADDFLEPEKAFQFSAEPHDAKSVAVTFAIAPGYYLYREQFKFAATGAVLGAPAIPPGKVKFDETFQKNVETYRNAVTIVIPVEQAGAEFRLAVTSQGCADAGLCYPPMQSVAAVALTGFGGAGTRIDVPPASGTPAAGLRGTRPPRRASRPRRPPGRHERDGGRCHGVALGHEGTTGESASGVEAVLRSGSFWPIVGAFFIAGLLLSLTPCVLPMLPIVSSIIVGQASNGSSSMAFAGSSAAAGAGAADTGAGISRGAASRSPRRIRSAWRSCTRRSASPPASPAKALPPRCKTRGSWARSRSASSRCRSRCSACTNCRCPRGWPAASRPRRRSCRPGASPACAPWAASRHSSSARASPRRSPAPCSTSARRATSGSAAPRSSRSRPA